MSGMGIVDYCFTSFVFEFMWASGLGWQFLAGVSNMSCTQVVKQLNARGSACDCIAWYPWRHESRQLCDQNLGFYSCGIFYIGGRVEVKA